MTSKQTNLNRQRVAARGAGGPEARRDLRPRRRRLVSESVPHTCRAAGVRRRSCQTAGVCRQGWADCTCGTGGWWQSAPLTGGRPGPEVNLGRGPAAGPGRIVRDCCRPRLPATG